MPDYICKCYQASCYILGLYAEKVLLDFIWHFQGKHCMDFVENANSGDICQYHCPGASDHVRLLYLTLLHALMVKNIHTVYAPLVHNLAYK